MMYLSQLQLDLRHRDTRNWLGDCHSLHRAVMSAFPQAQSPAARAELSVLFRVEQPSHGSVPVIVQSRERPAWAFETKAVANVRTGSLDTLEGAIAAGREFRFRLRANPTRRIHQRATLGADLRELDTQGNWRDAVDIPDAQRTGVIRRRGADTGRTGQRVELTREEDRIAWLVRRGQDHDGFEVVDVAVSAGLDSPPRLATDIRADPGGRLKGRRRDGGGELTFATALFEGRLRVTDVESFRHAWRTGIGPGKAFGCGLLSILPMT